MSRTLLPLLVLTVSACATPSTEPTERPAKDHTGQNDGTSDEDPWDDDGDDEPTDDDGDNQEEPSDDPQEVPQGDDEIEGAWITVDELLTEDHCNMEDYVLRGTGEQLILDVVGDGELEIIDDRGVNDCTYDTEAFDCEGRIFEDHTPSDDYGLSATILLETRAYGSFEGKESLFMQTDITANCDGDDCWMVELATASFPCQMRLWVAAEAN